MLSGGRRIDNLEESGMEQQSTSTLADEAAPRVLFIDWLIFHIRRIIVPAFTIFFLAFSLLYAGGATVQFLKPILSNGDMLEGLVNGLHMGVVALAVYELAQIVYQEYDTSAPQDSMVRRIRRGLIRFVSVVCTALVLESLIMVIKYSQKDLAGYLYYPVAIIVAAAILLMALGVFTHLSSGEVDDEPR
jgi:hypothetical protein